MVAGRVAAHRNPALSRWAAGQSPEGQRLGEFRGLDPQHRDVVGAARDDLGAEDLVVDLDQDEGSAPGSRAVERVAGGGELDVSVHDAEGESGRGFLVHAGFGYQDLADAALGA